jgi:hypothetical protein
MRLWLVIGWNLCLSLLLLGLAGWFWQWRKSLAATNIELATAIQETQIALKQATLRCQEQQLALLQARSQYRRSQKYLKQLQQLGQLISLGSWIGSRLFAKP